jgi:hypothetical protein
VDPNEECEASGCPSAAVNPLPERRLLPEPPRHDHILAVGWIWRTNVRRFLELASSYVGYGFDDLDWLAVESGTEALQSETDTFRYPIAGSSNWPSTSVRILVATRSLCGSQVALICCWARGWTRSWTPSRISHAVPSQAGWGADAVVEPRLLVCELRRVLSRCDAESAPGIMDV